MINHAPISLFTKKDGEHGVWSLETGVKGKLGTSAFLFLEELRTIGKTGKWPSFETKDEVCGEIRLKKTCPPIENLAKVHEVAVAWGPCVIGMRYVGKVVGS